MALKALMLRKKITDIKAKLDALRAKDNDFQKREEELTTAINEAKTEEETSAVEAEITEFDKDKTAHEAEKSSLEKEVADLESELAATENETRSATEPVAVNKERRMVVMPFNTRYAEMNIEQREALCAREDVKNFLARARQLASEKRTVTGTDLLIPDILLGLIREEVAKASRLLRFVRLVNVGGTSRQNIMGAIPEAVWTEMCAKLNELEFGFNQIEVDGYKVGGYIIICNATLSDSDINLAGEIISAIGGAIGKALDKAIIWGTGTKMPLGIVTRLAQTSEPSDWETTAPAWTDLHTSNVIKLNIDTTSGAAFFTAIIETLAVAKPKFTTDGLFWVMNRKTHLHIMAKALEFNANAALVASTTMFPIIGGTIVEFEDDEIADNEIIGGYGGNYLMAQREGVTFAQSEHYRFIEEQTVFKGTARYDGKPVAGEAFVILNFANVTPTTAKTFAPDTANP